MLCPSSSKVINNIFFTSFSLPPVPNLTEIPVAPPTTAASSVEEPEGRRVLLCHGDGRGGAVRAARLLRTTIGELLGVRGGPRGWIEEDRATQHFSGDAPSENKRKGSFLVPAG